MKKINQILILFAALLVFSSCEKVIEIDLEETDQQLVIEAQLKEGDHLFEVFISKTAPYFEAGGTTSIDNALVVLKDDLGNSTTVPLVESGRYAIDYSATAGKTYQLSVDLDGQLYEANSTLPQKVALLELMAAFQPAQGPIEEGYLVYSRYQDPGGVDNYYRIIHSVDGVPQLGGNDMQVFDDNLNDGSAARIPVFQKVFELGEEIEIELIHFDAQSYDYFNSLSDIIGSAGGANSGSAAPGNPNTNWSGGTLGYFSAYSSDTMSIIIE